MGVGRAAGEPRERACDGGQNPIVLVHDWGTDHIGWLTPLRWQGNRRDRFHVVARQYSPRHNVTVAIKPQHIEEAGRALPASPASERVAHSELHLARLARDA